jgi:type II secretory pathway component PulJ
MKTNKNKLPGFTLADVLVGMLISSIVLTSAYSGFERISVLFRSFKKNNEKIHDLTLFNRLLVQDFSRCNYISGESNAIRCIYNDREVDYTFSETYVLRKYSRVDTFNLGVKNVSMIPLSEEDYFSAPVISECKLQLNSEDSLFFHYKKEYAADILLALEKE